MESKMVTRMPLIPELWNEFLKIRTIKTAILDPNVPTSIEVVVTARAALPVMGVVTEAMTATTTVTITMAAMMAVTTTEMMTKNRSKARDR